MNGWLIEWVVGRLIDESRREEERERVKEAGVLDRLMDAWKTVVKGGVVGGYMEGTCWWEDGEGGECELRVE